MAADILIFVHKKNTMITIPVLWNCKKQYDKYTSPLTDISETPALSVSFPTKKSTIFKLLTYTNLSGVVIRTEFKG